MVKNLDYHGHSVLWKELLASGLREDGWPWDWTSLGTGDAQQARIIGARIVAKSEGVWAGSGAIPATNSLSVEMGGPADIVTAKVKDGAKFRPGDTLVEWRGPARLVLAYERPFLNLVSYVSGIATTTDRFVSRVRKACPDRTPRVTSTRKTLPGYRDLALQGVQAGGGHLHRVSLSGGVLIKENHVAAAGGIAEAIAGARAVAPHLLKVEIEVRNDAELSQALDAGADGVLLDNFSSEQVRKAVQKVESFARGGRRPFVEVSGGLSEDTIASYAIVGVDVLSVGSLTHSVKQVDLSLLVEGT